MHRRRNKQSRRKQQNIANKPGTSSGNYVVNKPSMAGDVKAADVKAADVKASDKQATSDDVPSTHKNLEGTTSTDDAAKINLMEPDDVGQDSAFDTAAPNINVASDQETVKVITPIKEPDDVVQDSAFETAAPNINVASDQETAKAITPIKEPYDVVQDSAFETAAPNTNIASDQETTTDTAPIKEPDDIVQDSAFETAAPNINVASDQETATGITLIKKPDDIVQDSGFDTATPNINYASDHETAKGYVTTESPIPETDFSQSPSSYVDSSQCEAAENPTANMSASAKRRYNRRKRKEEAANAQLETERETGPETGTPTSTDIDKPKNNKTIEGNTASTPSGSKRRRRRRKNYNLENEQSPTTSPSSASSNTTDKNTNRHPNCSCCLSKLADGWISDPLAGPSTSTKTDDECFLDFLTRTRGDPSLLMMRGAWNATREVLEKAQNPSNVVVDLLKEINHLMAEHERATDFIRRHTEGKLAMQAKASTTGLINSDIIGKAVASRYKAPKIFKRPRPVRVIKEVTSSSSDISDDDDDAHYSFENRNQALFNYIWGEGGTTPPPITETSEASEASDVKRLSELDTSEASDVKRVSEFDTSEASDVKRVSEFDTSEASDVKRVSDSEATEASDVKRVSDFEATKASHVKRVSKFYCPDRPLNIAPYQNIFNIKYGIGIILIKNLLSPITTSSLINGFGTFGQLIYHSQRKMRMAKGVKKIVGVVYKTRLHAAVAAMNLESQFEKEEEFTLVTSGSRKKEQKAAMEFLGVGFRYDKEDIIPLNTLERNIIDDAAESFQKVLYYCTS